MAFLDGTGLGHLIEKLKAAFVLQSDTQTVSTIDIDSTPTASSTNLVTSGGVKSYVDGAINALPEPMVFQGTIGTSGTSSTVPSSPTEGDTYKIIEGGTSLTFTGISDTIKVGDTVIYKNSTVGWVLIPSGDEPSGTVTSITAGAGLNTTSNDTGTDGGTISSSGTLYLTKSGVTAGTYQGITVDKYGRVTTASNQNYGTYSKPSGGIPESDLATAVTTKLNATEIFWADYGVTTYVDLYQAVQAGKYIIVRKDLNTSKPAYYFLSAYETSDSEIWFYAIFERTINFVYVNSSNVWDLQEASNLYSKPSGGIPASDLASGVIPSVPVQDVTVGGSSVLSGTTAVIPAIPSIEAMTNAEIDTAVNAAWVWEDDE